MNQIEKKYNDMFVQTQRHLDTHPDKWTGVPAIVRYKNTLDENITLIRTKDLEAGGATKGVTITKQDLKNQLSLKAAILCGAAYAYASEANDQQLMEQTGYSPSALYKLSDTEFAQTVKALTNLITSRLADLADQGVTETQVTEVATSLDDFYEMIGMPRSVAIQSAMAGAELAQVIKATNDLLNNQLDKAMLRYRLTDPSFYEGYTRARTQVD